MTELLIDGVQVVLPAEFTISVKRENPIFTKNGEYTYEITLSLINPTNAALYGFLSRINSVADIKEKRSAVLIADNRVYCNGTEVITGWTDKEVNVQIVSGNSELNYFIGSDDMISSLTGMPESNPFNSSGEADIQYIKKRYPDVDFNLAPVSVSSFFEHINEWVYKKDGDVETLDIPTYLQNSEIVPQPYLCAYIREVLKALGYTLTYNAIEDTPWRDTYIVHTNITSKWNLMLPGWTIKEFLSGVETFFNSTFVINHKDKTVKLFLNNNYIPNVTVSHVRQIVDEYSVECVEETENVVTSNVTYKLPDQIWYGLRNIPDIVWNTAEQRTIIGNVNTFFSKEENQKPNVIFYDTNMDRYMIYGNLPSLSTCQTVHQLAELKRENSSKTIELPFVPVAFYVMQGHLVDNAYSQVAIPFIKTAKESEEEGNIADMNITEMVEELKEEDYDSQKSILYLAFYSGYNSNPIGKIPANRIPLPYFDETILTSDGETLVSQDGATFRLPVIAANFYDDVYDIDTVNPIEITSYDSNLFDTLSVFEIHNKYFLCKEIEYTLTAKGRDQAWKGTFYPIKLLDGEADNRWILSDGKWRDNGVWLDNGRWLDE